MVVLNSNPEILLKKRKDRDRKRLEKQQQAIEKQLEQKRKNAKRLKKFVRVETLISNYKSNELEKKRIQHITKHQQREGVSEAQNEPECLLFLIRIPDHVKGLSIPRKARTVLRLLRLETPNTGVFVKKNSTTSPLLQLILPYVVAGTPSLASVRHLFQKRACISLADEESESQKIVKLDNNGAVEDKFGDDLGLICIEDLVHEIVTLGDNFKPVTFWLMPFKLNAPVSGWGPQAKLAKLQYEQETHRSVSLAGDATLSLIDIDKFIEEQN